MLHMQGKKKVGIVGARGYSGLELARILLRHPEASLSACFANEKSFALQDYLPEAAAEQVPVVALTEIEQMPLDTVFLATPVEASLELAPKLAGKMNVIDLSGAYRLKASDYPKWYGFEHSSPALLEKAAYGLAPLSSPRGSRMVSNPGCFATSVLMALVPLLRAGLLVPSSITIDAKSGATGAGRSHTMSPRSTTTPAAAYGQGCELRPSLKPWRSTKNCRIAAPAAIMAISTQPLCGFA